MPMRRMTNVKLYAGNSYGEKTALTSLPSDFLIVHTSFEQLKQKLVQSIQQLVKNTVSLGMIWYRLPDGDLKLILNDSDYSALHSESTISVWFMQKKSPQEEFADILELLDHQLTELQKTVHHYHLNPPGRR